MRTFRPPAGASLSHYTRLIGGTLALALALALTCAGETLGAQTFTSNLRGYVRTPAGAPVAEAQVVARDVETNQRRDDHDQRDRLLLHRRTEARAVRGDAAAARLRGAVATDPPCDRPDARPRLLRGRGDAAARRRRGDSGRRRRVAHLRGRHQRLARADPEPAESERNFLDIARLAPGMTATAVNDHEQVHRVRRPAGRSGERLRRRRELQERRAQGRRRRPGREQGQPVPAGRGAGVPRHHAELQGRIPEGGRARSSPRRRAAAATCGRATRFVSQHRASRYVARDALHAPQRRPRVRSTTACSSAAASAGRSQRTSCSSSARTS